jgi:chitinase
MREGVEGRIGFVYAVNGDLTLRCVAGALPPGAFPSLSVSDATNIEGGTLRFNVTLSAPTFRTVRVAYATADATATSPADYAAASGLLAFAPGETSKEVFVTTVGDGAAESQEAFGFVLSAPAGATLADPLGDGRINDMTPPTLSVADTTCRERQPCSVTLSLSSPSAEDVSVSFFTEDGTALFVRDYSSPSGRNGVVTIPAGQTSATITFDCFDDHVETGDADQFFFVHAEFGPSSSTAKVTIRP